MAILPRANGFVTWRAYDSQCRSRWRRWSARQQPRSGDTCAAPDAGSQARRSQPRNSPKAGTSSARDATLAWDDLQARQLNIHRRPLVREKRKRSPHLRLRSSSDTKGSHVNSGQWASGGRGCLPARYSSGASIRDGSGTACSSRDRRCCRSCGARSSAPSARGPLGSRLGGQDLLLRGRQNLDDPFQIHRQQQRPHRIRLPINPRG
jgi:hypothetical protein